MLWVWQEFIPLTAFLLVVREPENQGVKRYIRPFFLADPVIGHFRKRINQQLLFWCLFHEDYS